MKLSSFARGIIIEDAYYFLTKKFITISEYRRVRLWLCGSVHDPEIQARIKGWLESDCLYTRNLRRRVCDLLWYFWPFIWLGITAMEWHLRKTAKRL